MTARTQLKISERTRLPVIALGAAACLALLTNPVTASAAEDNQLVFQYANGELGNTAKANAVYERLGKSVRRYCAEHGVRGVEAAVRQRKCETEMLDQSIQKINNTRLTAIHTKENGNVRIASR